MSTRELARHWMRQVPTSTTPVHLVPWMDQLVAEAEQHDGHAVGLHRLHSAVLAIGLGQGARHMHARLGGDEAAPVLAGLETPEALLVTVGAILAASSIDRTPLPTAAGLDASATSFEAVHRLGPDVYDELLLEASGRAARDPEWRAAVDDFGAALAGAGRWFRRGPGKALEHQATRLGERWRSLDLTAPAHPRFTPWAQHLWVTAVLVAGLHPAGADLPTAPPGPAHT